MVTASTTARQDVRGVAPAVPQRLLALGTSLFLAGAGAILVFRAGAFAPVDWLPIGVVVALAAAVLALTAPRPGFDRQQLALFGALGALAIWTAASAAWAGSVEDVWQETNRSLLFLMTIGLSAAAVRWYGRGGVTVLGLVVVGVVALPGVVAAAATLLSDRPADFFEVGRLAYPVTYFNGLAALFTTGAWVALGLSTARRAPIWLSALLVAVAVGLIQLAVLPQSRGALWAFVLVSPLFLGLAPHRFRALAHFGLVVLATAVAWPILLDVYRNVDPLTGEADAARRAIQAIAISVVAVGVAGVAVRLVESVFSPLGRRPVAAIWAVLAGLVLVGAVGAAVALQPRSGEVREFAESRWEQLTSDRTAGSAEGVRFLQAGLSGRLHLWDLSWEAFREHPVNGLGAQNYEFYYYEHRDWDKSVKQPHSLPLRFLAELGLVGLVLFLAFTGGTLARGAFLRFQSTATEESAALAAFLVAAAYWLVHSGVDWLWQLAGVAWPFLLIMGGLLGYALPEKETGEAERATNDETRARSREPWVRGAVAAGLLAIALSAGLPYLSLRYQESARSLAGSSPAEAVRNAERAALLDPYSPEPWNVAGRVYALQAEDPAGADRPGDIPAGDGEMAYLALAAGAQAEAVDRKPVAWLQLYKAGQAVAALADTRLDSAAVPAEGSPLSSASPAVAADGLLVQAPPILEERARALLAMSREQLLGQARDYYLRGLELNPSERSLQEGLASLPGS